MNGHYSDPQPCHRDSPSTAESHSLPVSLSSPFYWINSLLSSKHPLYRGPDDPGVLGHMNGTERTGL